MLYVLHRGNHPELAYRGGQDPIVHLEADLDLTIQWAEANRVPRAFSTGNAGAFHAEFHHGKEDLDLLDWEAISALDFRDPDVKERKQAEFLLHHFFPFDLVERIGVRTRPVYNQVLSVLSGRPSPPRVEVRRDWYF